MQPEVTQTGGGIAHRIPAADHPTGHDLLAVDVWLPGTRPTEYAIKLSTGPKYRARYWRCRACGAERNRRDDFEAVCTGSQPVDAIMTDRGHSPDV